MRKSLMSKVQRLEQRVSRQQSPDMWDDTLLVWNLMWERSNPPSPESVEGKPANPDHSPMARGQAHAESLRRLKVAMASVDPENPQEPTLYQEMLAGMLGVDLADYAVNDRHRQVIQANRD